jgi:hypothetical protein
MQEFWWRLPLVRRLHPLARGLVVTGFIELILAAALVFSLHNSISHPQREFLGDLAGVGATIFVAFVIEMAAIMLWSTSYDAEDDALSGETAGFGFAALLGIGFALALSNHGESHALSWLEALGLSWSFVSLGILGAIVAAYPLLIYERHRPKSTVKGKKST